MSNNRHKWVKIENFKNEYHFYEEKHECQICGCVRGTYFALGWRQYNYERSGQIFSNRPDCINWKKENQKTID